MTLNLAMLEFIKECLKEHIKIIGDKGKSEKEWYVRFDDRYNIKYAFYINNGKSINIISTYTMFEYGYKVVTLSGDLVDGIIKDI